MLDAVRSYPEHKLFFVDDSSNSPAGTRSLFHVLAMYVKHSPHVGYCQGMAYIGGAALMVMSEEESFWMLVSLFDDSKYLKGMYDADLARVQKCAGAFHLLLGDRLPELNRHLDGLGILPLMYFTQWFMCFFTTLSCWDTVMAVWDLVFLEGSNSMFRVALAIMEVCSPGLLVMDGMGPVLSFIQHLPSRLVSHENLFYVILHTHITEEELEFYMNAATSADTHGPLCSHVTTGDQVDSDLATPTATPTGQRMRRRDKGVFTSTRKRKFEDHVPETATAVNSSNSQSLFGRLVNAFTPSSKRSHLDVRDTRIQSTTKAREQTHLTVTTKSLQRRALRSSKQVHVTAATPRGRRSTVSSTPSKSYSYSQRTFEHVAHFDESSINLSASDTLKKLSSTPAPTSEPRRKRQPLLIEMKDMSTLYRRKLRELNSSSSDSFDGSGGVVETPLKSPKKRRRLSGHQDVLNGQLHW